MVKDVLNTDAGNDVNLQGEGGDDILFGGDGNDLLFGDSDANALANDTQIIVQYGTYSYYWRERHVGLDGNDYLDRGAGDDQLMGGGGFIFVQPLHLRLAGKSGPAYLLAA